MKLWVCMVLRRTGPLGLPSRAGEVLAGRTALERAALRARRTPGVEGLAVLVEPGRADEVRRWLGASDARVLESLGPEPASLEMLRRARKWARDSWRGGIRQAMDLDSYLDFPALAAAGKELGAEGVLAVLPEAVLVEPGILAGMVNQAAPEGRIVHGAAFCQATGGFAGFFAFTGWLEAMVAAGKSFGQLLAYRPGVASHDPVHRSDNFLAPTPVRRAEFRGSLDSARAADVLGAVLARSPGADGLGPSAEEAVAIVRGDAALYAGRLPRIVDVELTTAGAVPFADTPSSRPLPNRQMTRELFEKLLADLALYDDVLLTLGGAGDPLAHPEVYDFLSLARERGIYGLHLETTGTLLDEAACRRLAALDVDIVSVRLGADSADGYRRLTGRGDFDAVVANVERLVAVRNESGRAWPFVAVEAEKRVESEPELLAFFDRWMEKCDCPLIRPFSDYAGAFPDRASVHLTLAQRVGCRRLAKELLVLADGTVPVCRMDFTASEPAGNIRDKSVTELWTSGRIAALRAEQAAGRFDGFGLCPKCRDWDSI